MQQASTPMGFFVLLMDDCLSTIYHLIKHTPSDCTVVNLLLQFEISTAASKAEIFVE